MAKAERKKLKQIVTPKGTAVWPNLTTPEYKYKEEGEYNVKLRVHESKAAEFVAEVEAAIAQSIKEAKAETGKAKVKVAAPPFKDELERTEDGSDGEPTGYLLFTLKTKASGTTKAGKKWERKLVIKDGAGKDFDGEVYRGSEIRAIISLKPYYTAGLGAGVTLLLEKVQVLQAAPNQGKTLDVDFDYVNAPQEEEDGDDSDDDATQF